MYGIRLRNSSSSSGGILIPPQRVQCFYWRGRRRLIDGVDYRSACAALETLSGSRCWRGCHFIGVGAEKFGTAWEWWSLLCSAAVASHGMG